VCCIGPARRRLFRPRRPLGNCRPPQPTASVRPCGLRRLRDATALRFPRRIQELRRPPDEKRPPTPLNTLLVASRPPTRRSIHIQAANSTRLKPRDGATRLRRRKQHLCQPPSLRTNKSSTRRRDTSNKIPESNTKILKTTQDTPWARPTSTKPPSRAMQRG